MRLPAKTAGTSARVLFSSYTARKCQRAGYAELAESARTAEDAMVKAVREVEDLVRPVQTAVADRDYADDGLDDHCSYIGGQLDSRRFTDAGRNNYVRVIPKGADYYRKASLDDQVPRYGELASRIVEWLVPDDPLRAEGVPRIHTELAAWTEAAKDVVRARNVLTLARSRRDAAVDHWEHTMEQIYG